MQPIPVMTNQDGVMTNQDGGMTNQDGVMTNQDGGRQQTNEGQREPGSWRSFRFETCFHFAIFIFNGKNSSVLSLKAKES